MKKNILYILLAVLGLIISSACLSSSVATNNITNSPASEQVDSSSDGILLREDFSNDKSGWDTFQDDTLGARYENGTYVINNDDPQSYAWGFANKFFTDTSIEVDAKLLSGPLDVESGIICRQSSDNFYFGIVSIDGYFGIFKSTTEDFNLIDMDAMPQNDSINLGNELNKIRFDCIGSTLSLYVNDILLAQVNDPDYTSGDIGLLVGTYDDPGATFSFDNLTVSTP